jgi:hypothetical protein
MNAIARPVKNHRSNAKHHAADVLPSIGDTIVSMRAMALCPFAETMTTEATDDRSAENIVALGAAGVIAELPRSSSARTGLRVGDEVWFRTE